MDGKTLLEKELYLMFRARNPELTMAFMQYFSDAGPWSVGAGNILKNEADAIVSPANSYGYMDGGIDLAYTRFFGEAIEDTVMDAIRDRSQGFLPIGKALIVQTGKRKIPNLIVAPTMETPRDVSDTNNAFLAMKAALEATLLYNHQQKEGKGSAINSILIPGMCTGVGRMDYFVAAAQMRDAVNAVNTELREHENSLDYLLVKD